MVKVLAINASPRKYGSSYKLLRVAVEAARYAGAEVSVVNLYDYTIKPCIGCVSDDQLSCRFPCVIDDDDGNALLKAMVESDALIVATPIYWYGPSGQLKNLIDRMTSLENMIFVSGRSLLEGKVGGFIASGADSGNIAAISYLMVVANSMGILIPPWGLAYYLGQGDPLESSEAVLDAANVGYLVAKAAQGLHPRELRYDPHLVEKLGGRRFIERVAEEVKELAAREFKLRNRVIKLREPGGR
ncbi:MAG: flavodoxin family protein [Desulfurococcaceae archaeon]|nr:flavodoxin family protein [Desulfurococcaceae archaeon]